VGGCSQFPELLSETGKGNFFDETKKRRKKKLEEGAVSELHQFENRERIWALGTKYLATFVHN
jgi:hypothetical protein